MKTISTGAFLLVLVFLVTGCGGGGGGGGSSTPPLAISPATITVDSGGAQAFTASGGTPPYTFDITAGGGTITGSGAFTAGTGPATVTVRVRDSANRSALATVTVRGPLAINPTQVTVGAGTNTNLVASGGRPPYTFAVVAGGGTVDASGRYTAPGTPGSATVELRDSINVAVQSQITINPPLALSPTSPIRITAASGTTFQYTGSDGVPPYTFMVIGPGTINANGLYTAGTQSGEARVQLRDAQGTTIEAPVESIWVRTNGFVRTAVANGDALYIGGDFTALNAYEAPRMIVMDAATGDPTLLCNVQDGFDGTVHALARSPMHIYAGGEFTSYQGTAVEGLARIDATTCQLDSAFSQGGASNGTISTLAIDGDALYLGGAFGEYRGTAAGNIAKVDAVTGALDTTFTHESGFGNRVSSLAVGGGAVYVGGFFGSYDGQATGAIAKLDAATGNLDTSFNLPTAGLDGTVADVAVDGSSVYAVGQIFTYRGTTVRNIVKLDVDTGNLDTTFAQADAFNSNPQVIAVSADSVYVGGGLFTTYRGAPALNLAKLDKVSGNLDTAFAANAEVPAQIWAMEVSGNALYIGGRFATYDGAPANELARIDATTGLLDTSFTRATGFDQTFLVLQREVRALAVSGSSLAVGGNFRTYRGAPANRLAKLSISTGAPDATFNAGGGANSIVHEIRLFGNALFVAGNFTTYRGEAYPLALKLDPISGAVDTLFNRLGEGFAGSSAGSFALSGNNLYVGGAFTSYRGVERFWLAKLDVTTGNLDPTFAPSFFFGNFVGSLQVSGGSVYAGGNFGGGITKFDAATGATDPAWPVQITNQVNDLVFANNSLYVGGTFSGYGTTQAEGLVRTSPDNVVDTTFTQLPVFGGLFPRVIALAMVGNSLYAAGDYRTYRNQPAHSIAKLNATSGALDMAFANSAGPNGEIDSLAPSATALWIGGTFTRYRNERAYFLAPVDLATGELLDP